MKNLTLTRFLVSIGLSLGFVLAMPLLANAQDCPYGSTSEASRDLGLTVISYGKTGSGGTACAFGDRARPNEAVMVRVRTADQERAGASIFNRIKPGKSASDIFNDSMHHVRNPQILSGLGQRAYMITVGSAHQQIIEVLQGNNLISLQTLDGRISADHLKALARTVVAHVHS